MMRSFVRSVVVGAAFLAGSAVVAGAQGRIGYVNTQSVLAQTPARTTAETEFNRRMAPMTAEAQRMDSTLKAMFATFTQDTTSPMDQREARAAEIQQRQQQFQQRMEQIEDSAQSLRAQLMQPIMSQLERALEDVRREEGYAMIFDVGPGTMLVAADTTLDVTPAVIAKMRTATATAAPARPAGPVAAPAGAGRRPPTQR